MNIPGLYVNRRNLPDAWEKSVLEVWNKGISIKTEYDKPNDPPSKDCTMMIEIDEPLGEPRIHMALPCRLEDLEKYRLEVVEGVHDDWIAPTGSKDPADSKKWIYTYHQRLFEFPVLTEKGLEKINQISKMVDGLAKVPYSRRQQAITWKPDFDPSHDDPPCLQRLWGRLLKGETEVWFFNMNTHWRSRDAYKAAYMNMFALTSLQEKIAKEIGEKMGEEVLVGRYVDVSDSYHVYGSYFDAVEGFLKIVERRKFYDPKNKIQSRTATSDDDHVKRAFEIGRAELEKEKATGIKGVRV